MFRHIQIHTKTLPVERRRPQHSGRLGPVGTWALLSHPRKLGMLSGCCQDAQPSHGTPASNPAPHTQSRGEVPVETVSLLLSLVRGFFLLPIRCLTFHQNSLSNVMPSPSPTPRVSPAAQRVIALGAKVTLGPWKQPEYVWQLPLKGSACPPRVPAVALPGSRPARTHPYGHKAPRARTRHSPIGNSRERATTKCLPPAPPTGCAHDAQYFRAARMRHWAPRRIPG